MQPTHTPRRGFLRTLGAAAAAPLIGAGGTATYTNPLDIKIADPYVLREPDGTYFMYGTGDKGAAAFPGFTSKDLVHWTPLGHTYQRNPADSWCTEFFWAPEVYRSKGRYFMVYSAQWRDNPNREQENFRIGAAVSDKPTGPFRDIRNAPLFDPGYPAIDADVLFDSDGRLYMFYSRCCYKHPVESELADWARKQGLYKEIEESWIYGVEVKPDFTGVIGEPALMLRPPVKMNDRDTAWESLSVTTHEINRRWTEGPCVFKHGGKYYLMYSANHYLGENYSLGYATADHPLGPYRKAANNPVLKKDTDRGGVVSGPAHNCITWSPDGTEMMCLYAGRTKATGKERVLLMDRMEIRKDGTLVVHGPTTTPQPLPSAKSRKG
ncbi:MAG: glycoside hydrolase family 43 protein [Acidobacteria bacterium]|nr:glycoside hydrolase family 43 protein [Acidobacteriota bacterium]